MPTSILNSQRPEDVSLEEEESLLTLFGACLWEEKAKFSDDELTLKCVRTLQTLNLDAETEKRFIDFLTLASRNAVDASEMLRLEMLLQSVGAKDLTDEEYAALKRLTFMFMMALEPRERRLFNTEFHIPNAIRTNWRSDSYSFRLRAIGEPSERRPSQQENKRENACDSVSQSSFSIRDLLFESFKKKALWDILGDARPRTLEEFMRVLRDKGILPRVSA